MTEREAALTRENEELKEKLVHTQRQLDLLVRHVFGKKSEQTPAPHPDQLDLELEAENEAIESAPPAPAAKAKGGSRKGRKVRAALWPEHLPVEETILVPLSVQQAGELYREIARDVSERLERQPARLIRQRLVRPVYQLTSEPHRPPVQAPAPPSIIEGGSLGVQLMAGLVLDKYLHHQPLCRQAKIMEWESGVKLSAATLCQSIGRLADAVAPIVRHIAREMWAGGVVQMDLTPVRCLSRLHEGGSFMGQWRPLAGADIDCRQAARRVSQP